MEALNVQPPNAITRVSEHMSEIIDYVEKIQANGFAYESSDGSGVYFHTKQLGDAYGKLDPTRNAHVSASDVQASDLEPEQDGANETSTKKDKRDFALWKASKEPGEPSWDSPWGKGRPGWHIECSAMTHHVLGVKLDIHTGGIDLKFPHHNNEIAQCEAHNATSSCSHQDHSHHTADWCKHFIHFGHLYIQGLKMSKSLKNFISIKDFLKSHSADHFRLFCLQFKYRSNLHFSADRIRDAVVLSDRIKGFFRSVQAYGGSSGSQAGSAPKKCESVDLELLNLLFATKASVDAALMDDFNTPLVLNLLLELISRLNQYLLDRPDGPSEVLLSVAKYVLEVLDLFGLEGLYHEFAHVPQLFAINKRTTTTQAESSTASELSTSGEEILRALVRFRAAVREEALKDPRSAQNSQILSLCDAIRNDELPQLGVHIEDLASGRSVFKLSSREERDATQAASLAAEQEAQTVAAQLHNKQQMFDALMQIAPVDLFRKAPEYKDKFTAFDDQGVPTHAIDSNESEEEELSKSQRKKLQKKLEKHAKSYTKYWQSKSN